MSPQFMALSQVDFITVGTVGPAGSRTFYLQAAQGDLVVSLIIEKEHAAALSLGIHQLIDQLGGISDAALLPADMELRRPIQPLFRVADLGLGYDEERDAIVIVAHALEPERDSDEDYPEVHLWASRELMFALSKRAAEVVAAGRPRCPLCNEPLTPGERHVCVRGNGHDKWVYRLED
jgi:uncharacterized repeat protein (TIGR03847 family)